MAESTRVSPRGRVAAYWAVGLGLTLAYGLLRGSTWRGSADLHTHMEAVATVLALVVGVMALVRFYAKKNNTFLFVGTGFLGTACLDGYHALVTSHYFKAYLPSDLPSLIPWSWVASRFFLAALMYLSYLAWTRERRLGGNGRIGERTVHLFAGALTLASFLFFAFVPLPRAYYPEIWFHRPEEFIPALFFLMALVGYLRKGQWRHDAFEHWLVLSLIVGLVSQALFMSYSGQLFDFEFDAAHSLKKVGYICVLTGLLINMSHIFRQAKASKGELAETNAPLKGDIAERERVVAALRDTEARARAVVETAVDSIVLIDQRGEVQAFNPAGEGMFGYRAEEVIGQNISMLMPAPQREEHGDYLRNYLDTGEAKIIGIGREVTGLRKDGSVFPLELSVSEIWQDQGRIFVGMLRDITERRQAEAALAHHIEELGRSNAELETFPYVASHDLQEPLRKVQAFGDRLSSKYAEVLDERGLDYLSRMQDAAGRMQALIQSLLNFSRIGTKAEPHVPVDLDAVALEVVGDLELRIQETGAEVVVSLLPTVEADPTQMRQIFQNLIGNALKYRREAVAPAVRVSAEVVDGAAGPVNGTSVKLCRIRIEDNGIGFEPEFADRIFGIFQRLHGRGEFEGTGVGLAICRKIAERHGGTISAEGLPGAGSCFTLTLPIPQERAFA